MSEFLGGGCFDPKEIELAENYWCRCYVCGEPIAEDGPSLCPECFHMPMRRRVR